MNESKLDTQARILAFAAVVEVGFALVMMFDPVLVVALLLGARVSGIAIALSRCFGVALLALGLACWPGRSRSEGESPAFRGMLVYNALIASYLVYLGTAVHLRGLLLWPAVVLHAVVALLLVWTRVSARLLAAPRPRSSSG